MDHQLVSDFQTYANSLNQGHLKSWKASSILFTLKKMPAIHDDEIRFLAFLKNCLEMEGFRSSGCELIMGWLYERKLEIAA